MNIFEDKEEYFTKIFVEKNVKDNYHIFDKVSDEDYLDYHIWYDQNWKRLYEEYLPNTNIIRGNNPHIIFHGGCLRCISQRLHGIDRCKGCTYFRFTNSKPNLFIEGESPDSIDQDGLDDFFNS